MTASASRLVEAIVAPLADDAEAHLNARAWAEQSIAEHAAGDSVLDEASARLSTPQANWRTWLPWIIGGFSALSIAVFFAVSLKDLTTFAKLNGIFNNPWDAVPEDPSLPGLTPADELLLFGDRSAHDEIGTWKALYESDPNDPAFLARYLTAFAEEKRVIPDELMDRAEELDPDNSFPHCLQAAILAGQCITEHKASTEDRKAGKANTYEVTDEQKYAKARSHLEQAFTKGHFDDHFVILNQRRIAVLGVGDTYAERVRNTGCVYIQTGAMTKLRSLIELIACEANSKDRDALLKFGSDCKRLFSRMVANESDMLSALVHKVIVTAPMRPMRDAAEKLDLPEMAEIYRTLDAETIAETEARRKRGMGSTEQRLFRAKGSVLAGLTAPMLQRYAPEVPLPGELALRPGRYADHTFLGRVRALMAWKLFGLCAAAAALSLLLHHSMSRKLSDHLLKLLRAADWCWIVGLGVLVPFLWNIVILYATPVSGREWSVAFMGLILSGGQAAAFFVSTLMASVAVIRCRCGACLGFLGMKPKRVWIDWSFALLSLLALPVYGLIGLLPDAPNQWPMHLGNGILGLCMLKLFVTVVFHAVGKPADRAIDRALHARVMVPVMMCAMLLVSFETWFHRADERRWVAQDRLLLSTPEKPTATPYEWDVAQAVRLKTLEQIKRLP